MNIEEKSEMRNILIAYGIVLFIAIVYIAILKYLSWRLY